MFMRRKTQLFQDVSSSQFEKNCETYQTAKNTGWRQKASKHQYRHAGMLESSDFKYKTIINIQTWWSG